MFARWRSLGVAFGITLVAGLALAQQSSVGGMSSRPRFQVVTTTSGAPGISMRGNAVGVSNIAYLELRDSAGTRTGYMGDASAGDGDTSLECDAASCNVRLVTGAGGAVLFNGTTVATTQTNTFAVTLSGFSSGGTGTLSYRLVGSVVTLMLNTAGITGTSNAVLMESGATDVPAIIRPSAARTCLTVVSNNGVGSVFGSATITTGGQILFGVGVTAAGFTAASSKGIPASFTCSYPL